MTRPAYHTLAIFLTWTSLAGQFCCGQSEPGEPSNAEATSETETKERDRDLVQKIAAEVKAKDHWVTLIESSGGAGTGFIVKRPDGVWLYSAAHVFNGKEKPKVTDNQGNTHKIEDTVHLAPDADIARVKMVDMLAGGFELETENPPKDGDQIVASGNSGGAAVIRNIDGEILGVGPDQFEVSNNVVPGNSGGPVFSLKTGKVIGLVTHGVSGNKDKWNNGTGFDEVRRFAARLDRDIKWEKTTFERLGKEVAYLDKFSDDSQLLAILCLIRPTTKGFNVSSLPDEAKLFLSENQERRTVKELMALNSNLAGSNMNKSINDLKKRYKRFFIKAKSRIDGKKIDAKHFSVANRAVAEAAHEQRQEIIEALETKIKAL